MAKPKLTALLTQLCNVTDLFIQKIHQVLVISLEQSRTTTVINLPAYSTYTQSFNFRHVVVHELSLFDERSIT